MSNNYNQPPSEPAFAERRRWPRVSRTPLGDDVVQSSCLTPLRFDTRDLPPCQQFLAWQDHMAAIWRTRLPDDIRSEDGFAVRQTVWDLRGAIVVQQLTPAFSYDRSPDMVRFSPIDHWSISFLRSGRSWTGVEGCVVQNEPGMIEVRSLGRPFSGRTLAAESVSLIVPVDLFSDHGGLPSASDNVAISGHRARLLIDYLSSIETQLAYLTQDELPCIRDRFREMIYDMVVPLVDHDDSNSTALQTGLMARARRFISNNIASPNLTPEALSQELAISRTRLYELFEASGGVANYIRQRRLLTARAILADPSDTRKISEVGMAVGFESAANFSRAFTQQLGYSPSNIRKQITRNDSHPDTESHGKRQATFEGLLRALGSC